MWDSADRSRSARMLAYLVITPPDDEEPVEPLVPELLLVPAAPVDGDVVVELPDEPMPEVVPERDVGAVAVDEPLTDPPAEPMPDAVPEADPVVLHAPRAAAHANARSVLIMVTPKVKR